MDYTPEKVDLSHYIHTTLMGDTPHLKGRRLSVYTLTKSYEANGFNVMQTAEDYGISDEEVLVALLYYRQHQTEIETQVEAENRHFEEQQVKQSDHWKNRRL
jgi:uncharacterized protein (DUF433 family)